jgi:signal transduction histidine kinase
VEVELKVETGSVVLSVQDNGQGIIEAERDSPQSLGLLGMRERAELLRGWVTIQGDPDRQGTMVTINIPQSAAPRQIGERSDASVDRR